MKGAPKSSVHEAGTKPRGRHPGRVEHSDRATKQVFLEKGPPTPSQHPASSTHSWRGEGAGWAAGWRDRVGTRRLIVRSSQTISSEGHYDYPWTTFHSHGGKMAFLFFICISFPYILQADFWKKTLKWETSPLWKASQRLGSKPRKHETGPLSPLCHLSNSNNTCLFLRSTNSC